MRIATWNVNGLRARAEQLSAWLAHESPDVVCLQEIKATLDQIPEALAQLPDHRLCWHGMKGYSGVALLVKRGAPDLVFTHPPFDVECRAVSAMIGGVEIASLYVPNGGKDLAAKLHFLEAMDEYARQAEAAGRPLIWCGDLNVARTDHDVHPKEKKAVVGQLPEERALLERILSRGLVDVGRALDPDNHDLFTWWAPWRNLRQKNVGWRIDYILASRALAARATRCTVYREVGTSDHAPVVAELELP